MRYNHINMEYKEENMFKTLLCHACLCVGRSVYKITNENLIRYYLDALDEIPLSKSQNQIVNIRVCWECKAILQKSWSFREQAKDCYRILLAYTNESLNECLLSDISRPSHLQIQNLKPISITTSGFEDQYEVPVVKDEFSDNGADVKDEFTDNCADVKNESDDLKGVGGPIQITTDQGSHLSDNLDNDCLSDTEHENGDEELKPERELETIICSIERNDKKLRRHGKHKPKRTKKITTNLEGKKPSRPNINKKVVTIELSYEEMLAEREKDLKRDTYLKAEYKCETCIIGFNYKRSYQAHLNGKHSPDIGEYICPICKTIISSVDTFTSHYKRHMRRYECILCHKRTSDLKVMQQHYYSTHEISVKNYICNICGKVSNSVDTHRYHKDTHKARVQCTECDKTFRHRAGLMNHRLAVHEYQNAFPCTVCDKVFRWKTSLKRHLQKHEAKNKSSTPASPFCSMCNISFSSVCSYQRHMRNSLKHVTQDQLRFICDHCKRRFSDKTKLRDHIEEKHLNKTYQCHICSKPSKNRVGLDQHIRNVHKGRPKNKMCHHCGRGFPTKMQLESHIRTHTGERPFICEFCPTTFSQQSNLYKHNRQVHLNIKTKRHPICKKRKEDESDTAPKGPVLDNQAVIEEPYRAVVLQYSPERGFVL